jgi:hypothetical protein
MTLSATKRLLTSASLLILLAAMGILVWGFSSPKAGDSLGSHNLAEAANGPHRVKTASTSTNASGTDRTIQLAAAGDLAGLLDRPLRRPLFDPPPPPPKIVEKRVLPPIRTRLLATMIEPDNSTAILKLPNGDVVFRKVGQMLGTDEPTAKIARIEAGSVCVSREGDEIRLLVDGQKSR